LEKKVQDPW